MISILGDHLQTVADLYSQITPGQNLTPLVKRSTAEVSLLEEISVARDNLRNNISSLGRPRLIRVATGGPKGTWAHIYYVSFHDPQNSYRPTEGFYPAFLVSVDQMQCWLTVMVAAASVGISGRGGWSNRRGAQLRQRAAFLGRNLTEQDGWRKGIINLGPHGSKLHMERGSSRSSGRGYECGSIIANQFDPHNPPQNLAEWLGSAFRFYDAIYQEESVYIKTSVPHISGREVHEQANAAITGQKAEAYFVDWAPSAHPEWGDPVNRTDRVGLGYDVEFPNANLKVEVKGCRGDIETIRLTEREWAVAKTSGSSYLLAIVSNVDTPGRERVTLIPNPYNKFLNNATEHTILQVTYTIPSNIVRQHGAKMARFLPN